MLSVTIGDVICLFWAESRSESSSAAFKRMNLEEFLEQFEEDEENEKVATNFYPLSCDIVMF